jgi:hypothetical protein
MELHLPDTKSDFSRRPISVETLAAIDSVEPLAGAPFVFRAVRNPRKALPNGSAMNLEKDFAPDWSF